MSYTFYTVVNLLTFANVSIEIFLKSGDLINILWICNSHIIAKTLPYSYLSEVEYML